MAQVFVSYSRKNLKAAERVVEALIKRGFKVWFDKHDIPLGERWLAEIHRGIEGSDAFLFLLSPESARSEVCSQELAHAKAHGKRILPAVLADASPAEFHDKGLGSEIASLNWVFCREGVDDLEAAMDDLKEAILTDYDWVRFHTALEVKALAWDGARKDVSRFIIGNQLKDAEARLAAAGKKDPPPTELQKAFVAASRKFVRFLWRLGGAVSAAVLVAIVILFVRPYVQMERALPGSWVSIPAGTFTMGMDEDEAALAISLCNAGVENKQDQEYCPRDTKELLAWSGRQENAELPEFRILDNEVTNAQYRQCVDDGWCISPEDWGFESVDINKPAANLGWKEASAYCEWLGGRLPTEGEWEKAARGPLNTIFPWGDEWDPQAANLEDGESAGRIDAFAATDTNDYRVHNMAGNVMEWTASVYVEHVNDAPFSNPVLTPEMADELLWVIIRGGSWRTVGSEGMASHRGRYISDPHNGLSDPNIGFRCVCPDGEECRSPWSLWWIWSHEYYPGR